MKSFDSTTGQGTWITPPKLQQSHGAGNGSGSGYGYGSGYDFSRSYGKKLMINGQRKGRRT